MKKKFIAIAALIMSLLIGTSAFGCNLVTPNNERDLNQVVATVNIGNEGLQTEKIYKQDMIMGYLNYGYNYAQQGYSQEQVFTMIIDNLINNRIIVQYAMQYMEENSLVENANEAKWSLVRYLDEEESTDALYNTVKYMNDLIDSYEEDKEDLKQDTLTEEVRTSPTDAQPAEDELQLSEKQEYIGKGIIKGLDSANNVTDADRYKAYNKVLAVLKANGLLGENVTTEIETSEYYEDLLKSQRENALIEKFENARKDVYRKEISFAALENKYVEMYEDQQNKYQDNLSAFTAALSSASAKSPIFYNETNGSYGYVYNLLLGASEDQTSAIGKLTALDKLTTQTQKDERNTARKEILSTTKVKDLRSTWILSGYDYDEATNKFTGDYTFAKDSANSLPFYGAVTKLADKTDEKAAQYRIDSVREFTLDEFIAEMDSYLGISTGANVADATDPVYRKALVPANTVTEYDEKINELLFAFSTDSGSLNTYKGYVISPEPDFDGEQQWVDEFAAAGREILTMGGNSYIIVASDYGYHVMFYSEVLTTNTNYATLTAYLNATYGSKTWSTEYANMLDVWDDEDAIKAYEDTYLYTFADTLAGVADKLSKEESKIFADYKYDANKNYVVKYENAYSDLLGK